MDKERIQQIKLNTDYQMEKLLSTINTVLENRGKTTVASINADTSLRNDLGLDNAMMLFMYNKNVGIIQIIGK